MTTVAQPVNGQDINLAARATRNALELLLADHGTSFRPLAAMNVIASRGAALEPEDVVASLSNAFDVENEPVKTILHGLETRGLVRRTTSTVDGKRHFELTEEGKAEHQRLSALTATLTAELYRGFEAEDLATTRRVLVALTERANARVAAMLG